MTRHQQGFSLVELVVAMMVLGIVGIALTRMLISDSRFVSKVEAMLNARQAARAAMNTMVVELRMVANGGLSVAEQQRVTVRVPYAMGLLCDISGTTRFASLLPSDSITMATAVPDGVGWRAEDGNYTYHSATSVSVVASAPTRCTNEGISKVTGGQYVSMTVAGDTLSVGAVFFLYQTVQFRFAGSIDLPGRLGLFRQVGTQPDEELLAPFETGSAFEFYVGTAETPDVNPPVDLSTVVGLELKLVGASDQIPQGNVDPETFTLRTRVNFLNRQ